MNPYITEKQRVAQGDRLKEFRMRKGLSQKDFSDLLEMSQSSYSDIERGRNGISNAFAITLMDKTDVNLHWLIKNEGEMMRFNKEKNTSNTESVNDVNSQLEAMKKFLKDKFPDFDKE